MKTLHSSQISQNPQNSNSSISSSIISSEYINLAAKALISSYNSQISSNINTINNFQNSKLSDNLSVYIENLKNNIRNNEQRIEGIKELAQFLIPDFTK